MQVQKDTVIISLSVIHLLFSATAVLRQGACLTALPGLSICRYKRIPLLYRYLLSMCYSLQLLLLRQGTCLTAFLGLSTCRCAMIPLLYRYLLSKCYPNAIQAIAAVQPEGTSHPKTAAARDTSFGAAWFWHHLPLSLISFIRNRLRCKTDTNRFVD